ncbi:MAG TPA: FtsQ-type POTRA domain-containing protein [Anaerolineales bacterium]
MTTLQKTSRANFVRERRTPKTRSAHNPQGTKQTNRKTYHSASVFLPVKPQPVARRTLRQAQGSASNRATKKPHRNGYDISFTLGRANVRAPVLNIPQLGSRWVSAAMTLILSFMLYTLWTASPFTITAAEVRGNQRLGAVEINAMLGIIGQPIFKAIPAQMETNLHTAYSDLEYVKVHVGFPNHITVDVKERVPVLAWYQNGVVTWVDASGIAFRPLGEVPGLVQVAAKAPPAQVPLDPSLPLYEQKFITPEMVLALTVMAHDVPAGMSMIFDPQYGMGWQDPRGWTVYFGQNTKDIPMKTMVYQAIVNTLTLQGVQPSLISVEYLNAPFYK